jgi:energy-coupling factor transporter ATP-binding protein EcfA2
MIRLSAVRPGQPLEPYDYAILVLGASGNGKSTFVNSLVCVILGLSPGTLRAAIACKKYPSIIPELDDGLQERNDAASGQSQTTYAHFYKLAGPITDGKTVLIVDTPGLAAAGGVTEDDANVQVIIQAAKRVASFNAILVVEKSSTNRLNPCIEYNLYRIAEIIPRDFECKVILAFTFNQGKVEFEDQWFAFPIQHKLKMNNLAFGYSTAEFESKPKLKVAANWDQCIKRFRKFFAKLFTMEKTATAQYNQLFIQHNTMMNKIADFRANIENIETCKKFVQNARPGDTLTVNTWVTTTYHNTVCCEHRTVCHEECFLNYNPANGTSFFNSCACMNQQKVCKVCGCQSEQHVHKHEKPGSNSTSLEAMLDSMNIGDKSSSQNILKALEDKENKLITDLLEIEASISDISPKYKISKYLTKARDHLEFQINTEQDPNRLKELHMLKAIYDRLAAKMQT